MDDKSTTHGPASREIYDLALRAYRATSFVPEKRAAAQQAEFLEHLRFVKEEMQPLAKTPEQHVLLEQELAALP